MEKSVLDTICASLDTFFESERKIGTYIIQHTAKVVDMTVGELAQACGVSDASVSRFCKKIDMKGFHHFKITLAKEISERGKEEEEVSNHISVNDIGQSLKNILANKVTEITQTVSMMDTKQLHEILDKLNTAKTVQFFAVGNTIPVAIDGAFKLNQIGIPAVSGTIWETQIGYTYNMMADDVVIAISNSGESTAVLRALEAARSAGATTISITNSEKSSAAQLSDYHITTATREKLFLDGYCFSRVSATTVIEILYLFLTSMRKDAYKSVVRHEQAIAFTKL
ncbi:MurR/RpiR family transcriptional regulator [Anaerobutyricum hallii]|uniref:MurR/RpiR family transcriptional regulator n=1 Tax=Anaerobutyricum hallii TaxID=39488 RepID=A0A415UG11_9FIRM|nr:MurR/RpiR family transcriptional regulator [Anaerobutyricum hallii]RHN17030.1 MurR/RpiR family transcriptional regulator [Anaerobutyricum hallii]